MARATFVKAARKDYPQYGIKKGESYYWWKFRYGGKRVSKTAPRPSQLTNSDFLSTVYGALEMIEDVKTPTNLDEVENAANDIREAGQQIEEAGSTQEDNLSNMPEGLQQGDTGQMMEQRASDAGQLAGDLDQIADDLDDVAERLRAIEEKKEAKADGEAASEDDEEPESVEDLLAEAVSKIEEAQGMSYDGE